MSHWEILLVELVSGGFHALPIPSFYKFVINFLFMHLSTQHLFVYHQFMILTFSFIIIDIYIYLNKQILINDDKFILFSIIYSNNIIVKSYIKSINFPTPLFFRKYATIVFLANNRFETGKRKLSYLTFEDFSICASAMMTHWTTSEKSESMDDCDLEKEFLIQLRELKVVLEREKEHRK